MSDETNGFLIRGEFTFALPDATLPVDCTHQEAMDLVRRRIESVGGQVVAREDSEIDRLRARPAEVEATANVRAGQLRASRRHVEELKSGERFTEWGAKWSDGGYCPANPPRDEEFARKHARMWGTKVIRRSVGPWVYADTGEVVWP